MSQQAAAAPRADLTVGVAAGAKRLGDAGDALQEAIVDRADGHRDGLADQEAVAALPRRRRVAGARRRKVDLGCDAARHSIDDALIAARERRRRSEDKRRNDEKMERADVMK